jgi:WD40 repeat protein
MNSGILVSAGKDKNLRSYNSSSFEYEGPVNNAHSDQINCLASDAVHLYSGSKDGVFKVWRSQEPSDLLCVAKLDGNATQSSVNALTVLDSRFGVAVATANSDRSLRIWQQMDPEDIGRQRDSLDLSAILTHGSALSQLRIALNSKGRLN